MYASVHLALDTKAHAQQQVKVAQTGRSPIFGLNEGTLCTSGLTKPCISHSCETPLFFKLTEANFCSAQNSVPVGSLLP